MLSMNPNQRPQMKQLTTFFLSLTLLLSGNTNADDSAMALKDQMIERLGGKAVWSNLTNTVNGSVQNRAGEPNEVYSVISLDFTEPRFKIETYATDIYLVRVINGNDSWRISWDGIVEDLPERSFDADMLWYQAHVYRTIHRLALGDPELSVKLDQDRLEVFEYGKRLVWFKLDTRGEPFAFGFRDDDEGSLCGPWSVIKNGVRHPSWVSHADGTWRAAIKALEFNVPFHDAVFARPLVTSSD